MVALEVLNGIPTKQIINPSEDDVSHIYSGQISSR